MPWGKLIFVNFVDHNSCQAVTDQAPNLDLCACLLSHLRTIRNHPLLCMWCVAIFVYVCSSSLSLSLSLLLSL